VSISPLPISIFTDISEPKISAISLSIPISFTAALFDRLTLENVEKAAKFYVNAVALSALAMSNSAIFTLNTK